MSIAHFIIDMQPIERRRFLPRDWRILSNTICKVTPKLEECGAVTIRVVTPRIANARHELECYPVEVASYDNLRDYFQLRYAYDLGREFSLPVNPHDLVAIKVRPSACTSTVMDFLHRNNIDTAILTGVWETRNPQDPADSCVTQTAIDLARAGIEPIIVKEATNVAVNSRSPDIRTFAERRDALKAVGVAVRPMNKIVQWAQSSQSRL